MQVDMSARGVTARLKRASQLRRLCLSLGRAQKNTGKHDPRLPQKATGPAAA